MPCYPFESSSVTQSALYPTQSALLPHNSLHNDHLLNWLLLELFSFANSLFSLDFSPIYLLHWHQKCLWNEVAFLLFIKTVTQHVTKSTFFQITLHARDTIWRSVWWNNISWKGSIIVVSVFTNTIFSVLYYQRMVMLVKLLLHIAHYLFLKILKFT